MLSTSGHTDQYICQRGTDPDWNILSMLALMLLIAACIGSDAEMWVLDSLTGSLRQHLNSAAEPVEAHAKVRHRCWRKRLCLLPDRLYVPAL
jgi:hypothetical protein